MGEETQSNHSWQKYLKDPLKPLSIDQAYKWVELLKPALQDGVIKAKEVGAKARGDMVGALDWFNSMSAPKQKYLIDMATGAVMMTKDAVAVLTETTAKECGKVHTLVSQEGLSKAVQIAAMDTLQKAQELYAAAIGAANVASSQAAVMANLKREEFLASGSVAAMMAWAEATKKAVEESVTLKVAMETGGDAMKAANESYLAALITAEQKRIEALQLSSVYLTAAQEHMVALSESEQGKKLWERTQKLLELTRQKTVELQREPLVMIATQQLEANYKLACRSLQAAQQWVAAILGYQKEATPASEQVVASQIELVSALENGAKGIIGNEDVWESKPMK